MYGINEGIQPASLGCTASCGVVSIACLGLVCTADGPLPIADALAPKIAAGGGIITSVVGDQLFG